MAEWWITIWQELGETETVDVTYRVAASQAEVEALAAEISTANNIYIAEAHGMPEPVTIEYIRKREAEAFKAEQWGSALTYGEPEEDLANPAVRHGFIAEEMARMEAAG